MPSSRTCNRCSSCPPRVPPPDTRTEERRGRGRRSTGSLRSHGKAGHRLLVLALAAWSTLVLLGYLHAVFQQEGLPGSRIPFAFIAPRVPRPARLRILVGEGADLLTVAALVVG